MKSIKRIFTLCVILSTLAVIIALTSCNVSSMVSSGAESMIDKATTGDNYTVEYKTESDIYYTLKVADGQLSYTIKAEEASADYYLFRDDETGKYYFAREWKYSEKNKGVEKAEITKEQYLSAYINKFNTYSHTGQAFLYRHVLEMAKPVGDDCYEYSKEYYAENVFIVTEYSIEAKDGRLVLLSQHTENIEQNEDEEDNGQSLKILTEKITYFNFDDTEVKVPNKVLNISASGKYASISNTETDFNSFGDSSEEEEEPKEDHEHTFSQWKITVMPGCAKDGEQTRGCSSCGYIETMVAPATGEHEYRAWETATEPTCTEDGVEERLCFYCDSKETQPIPAVGHKQRREDDVAPSCEKEGYEDVKKCKTCGEITSGTVIPALGHDIVKHEALDPTCTEPGHNAYETCTRCDYSTYEEYPATGHNYENGSECSKCGATEENNEE